jgi:hypothetical protein
MRIGAEDLLAAGFSLFVFSRLKGLFSLNENRLGVGSSLSRGGLQNCKN